MNSEGTKPYIYMYPFSPKTPSWEGSYFGYKVLMGRWGHRGTGGIQETQESWHHGEGRLSSQRWSEMGELKGNFESFTADGDFKN